LLLAVLLFVEIVIMCLQAYKTNAQTSFLFPKNKQWMKSKHNLVVLI